MLQAILSLTLASQLLLVTSLAFVYYFVLFLLDPLRDVPGPFLARFTRFWYAIEVYQGSFELSNIKLHKKYGPIVRIAPNAYSIDDMEAAKIIYGHGQAFNKTSWYYAWQQPKEEMHNLFADRDPRRHGLERRKFANYYSMSTMIGYEQFVNNCTSLLAQRFSEIARAGQTVNLQHWLQCYAFDVIGEITFGNRFGFLDFGEDKAGVFHAIDQRGAYGTYVGIFPWLHPYLFPYLPKSGGPAYIMQFTLNQIDKRQKLLSEPMGESTDQGGPPDFMNKILAAHSAAPEKMTKLDLVKICHSNISAGSDTTAVTLSSILYHLILYPKTYQRLRHEIDDAARQGTLSDPVTFKEAQGLRYLQAVIKEGLRMHPATGLPLVRTVPKEGSTIVGRHFPANTTVGINAWVAHRNTTAWGPDADVWRPERWLEIEDEGRGGEAEKYFMAFGMGSRTCIGKNISLLEISKLIPQLVRKFDFELDEDLKREGMKSSNVWFVKQLNFKAKVFPRYDIGEKGSKEEQ